MWDEAAKGFEFEIGAVVRHKARLTYSMVVVEQILQRCHGGIQRQYLCSYIGRGGERCRELFVGAELEPANTIQNLMGEVSGLHDEMANTIQNLMGEVSGLHDEIRDCAARVKGAAEGEGRGRY